MDPEKDPHFFQEKKIQAHLTPPQNTPLQHHTIPTAIPYPVLASSLTLQDLLPRLVRSSALPPHVACHRDCHPDQPHDSRNDPVGDFPLGRVVAELETQTTVDDAERDERATEPDVGGGPDRAAIRPLEDVVVQDAEERLEREQGDDQQADDGMGIVNLFGVSHRPGRRRERKDERLVSASRQCRYPGRVRRSTARRPLAAWPRAPR